MIYLLGVNHQVQWNRDFPESKDFIKYIYGAIKSHQIHVLAEEWNDDASDNYGIATTILENIAYSSGLEYVAIDPDVKERQERGIMTADQICKDISRIAAMRDGSDEEFAKYKQKMIESSHPKKEAFWLEQLNPFIDKNILVVCGSQHISEFSANSKGFDVLLKSMKIDFELLQKRFD